MAQTYYVETRSRAGTSRVHEYTSDDVLAPGAVLRLDGRFWLVESGEHDAEDARERLVASPARYRVSLRYPDAREEGAPSGAFAWTDQGSGMPSRPSRTVSR